MLKDGYVNKNTKPFIVDGKLTIQKELRINDESSDPDEPQDVITNDCDKLHNEFCGVGTVYINGNAGIKLKPCETSSSLVGTKESKKESHETNPVEVLPNILLKQTASENIKNSN